MNLRGIDEVAAAVSVGWTPETVTSFESAVAAATGHSCYFPSPTKAQLLDSLAARGDVPPARGSVVAAIARIRRVFGPDVAVLENDGSWGTPPEGWAGTPEGLNRYGAPYVPGSPDNATRRYWYLNRERVAARYRRNPLAERLGR